MVRRLALLVVLVVAVLAVDDMALVKDIPDIKAVYDKPWYSGYLQP